MVNDTTKISKNPLDRVEMRLPWIVHEQAYLLHNISNVWSGEGQVLESTHDAPIGTVVYCDNISAVYMSTNLVQHQRTKHVEIDLHFVRERVAFGDVRVLHIPTSSQYVDIFTKRLSSPIFTEFQPERLPCSCSDCRGC